MHKSSLIQTLLIVLGILSLYQGLRDLLTIVLSYFPRIFENEQSEFVVGEVFILLLFCSINFILDYFLIWRSGPWSKWVVRKSNLEGEFKIISSPGSILYFLFLILGVNGLIKELPFLLDKTFISFRAAINERAVELSNHSMLYRPWTPIILNVLLPLLLILLAKNFATYFSKNLDQTDKIEISDFKEPSST